MLQQLKSQYSFYIFFLKILIVFDSRTIMFDNIFHKLKKQKKISTVINETNYK